MTHFHSLTRHLVWMAFLVLAGCAGDAVTDPGAEGDLRRSCGNGACGGAETCASCPQDCGVCGSPDMATAADLSAPADLGTAPADLAQPPATDGGTTTTSCAPAPSSTLVVNPKDAPYNAKGDGVTDDTAALQAAVNAVAGTGGTLAVPAGTYMINALTYLRLGSTMTMRLASGAVLKAIPNGSANYHIVLASGVHDVNVIGGAIVGERSAHTGTTGEWGMGLSVVNSQRVVVEGVTASECWGDGFYVSDGSSSVKLCNVVSDHNRRQGLSITKADGVVVQDSTFKNTAGTLPEDGIDIEPNSGETVNNVLITRCTALNNGGYGFETGVPISITGLAFITNVVLDGNLADGNGKSTLDTNGRAGFVGSNESSNTWKNNTARNTTGDGFRFRNNANDNTITGNTATANSGSGIIEWSCSGNTITGNTSTNNGAHGIYSTGCTGGTISGNTVSGNGLTP